MYKLLSIILNWFIAKEKPVETKPGTSTQVVFFDCVDAKTEFQEPFHSGDKIDEIDWMGETYFHVGIN